MRKHIFNKLTIAAICVLFGIASYADGAAQKEQEYYAKKYEDLLKDINKSVNFNPKPFERFLKEFSFDAKKTPAEAFRDRTDPEKTPHIFYLYSFSMEPVSVENFIFEAASFRKKHPEFKFYGVLRGFPKKSSFEKIEKIKKELDGISFKTKFHPYFFRDLNIERVPAIVVADCPKNFFRYRQCEFKYVVRGDISLKKAFEVISKREKIYKRYYFDLLEAETEGAK